MEGAKSSGGGGREEVGRRRNRGRISERVERRERSERGESGRREKETRWTGRIHPHGAAVFRAGVAAVEGMLRGRFEGWGCYIRPARGGESSVRPREAYRSRGCDDRSFTRVPRSTGLVLHTRRRACPLEQKASPLPAATPTGSGPRRDSSCSRPLARESVQPWW